MPLQIAAILNLFCFTNLRFISLIPPIAIFNLSLFILDETSAISIGPVIFFFVFDSNKGPNE